MSMEQYSTDGNRPVVANLLVNAEEHAILEKFKDILQERFTVKICMPKRTCFTRYPIFASVQGLHTNLDFIKQFLAERMNDVSTSDENSSASDKDYEIPVIVLSDSDEDTSTTNGEMHHDSSNDHPASPSDSHNLTFEEAALKKEDLEKMEQQNQEGAM